MTKSADYLLVLSISYWQILLGNSTTFVACEAQVNKFEQVQLKSHGDIHVATMTKISTVSVFNTMFLKQVFPVFKIDTIFCMWGGGGRFVLIKALCKIEGINMF